jgi:hypothetical protein
MPFILKAYLKNAQFLWFLPVGSTTGFDLLPQIVPLAKSRQCSDFFSRKQLDSTHLFLFKFRFEITPKMNAVSVILILIAVVL